MCYPEIVEINQLSSIAAWLRCTCGMFFSKVTVYLLGPLVTFQWKLGQEMKIRKNCLTGGSLLQDAIASSSNIIVKFSGLIN